MVILLPIGRKTTFTKFPWVTIGLIAFNISVFLLTWPTEKRFLNEQVSYKQVSYLAHQLVDLLVSNDSELPEAIKSVLQNEKKSDGFPTPQVDEIFQSIQDGTLPISRETQYKWSLLYPRYMDLKNSLDVQPGSHRSIFSNYGFSSEVHFFPNIFTYQFLHAGVLHIFFNMLFLWIVGCNVEERWGPILLLSLYLLGGAAAALVQSAFCPTHLTPMVGASGSVAAIMGAFLIRHATIKIRVFYLVFFFILIRFGVFEMPAWVALPLWFFQQLFMGLMTVKHVPEVGYWAHVGGFIFGVIGGILIKTFHIGHLWEQKAEQTQEACDLKAEKGFSALYLNRLEEAEKIFTEIVGLNPRHIKAHQGLLQLYEKKKDNIRICKEALVFAKVALESNNIVLLSDILNTTKSIDKKELSDSLLFQLASVYEKTHQWEEAVQIYKHIMEKFPKSLYLPKVLFSLGKILKQELHREREARGYFERLLQPPYDMEWGVAVREYLKD